MDSNYLPLNVRNPVIHLDSVTLMDRMNEIERMLLLLFIEGNAPSATSSMTPLKVNR